MKIGDRIYVRGYVDEIRKDTVIVRNNGGYFGTIPSEVITGELPSAQPEVIHCCECQHWKQGELVDKCGLLDCYADADCYCAWAVRERRQDEQTD